MSELRDLLDSEAHRIQGGDHALGSVMRRVQRRRRTRRVATGTLALMIAAVGTFGAYRAFRPSPVERGLSQAGTNEVFEGIWPETGFDELAEAQRAIDEGHQPWRTDPVETARAFATNVMQWKYNRVEAAILDDPRAVSVQLVNRGVSAMGANVAHLRATFVTLNQLGRKGPGGVWSVVEVGGGLLRIPPPGLGVRVVEIVLQPGETLHIAGDVVYDPEGVSVEAGLFAGEGGIPFESEGSLTVRRFEVNDDRYFTGDLGPAPEDPDGSIILFALARDSYGKIIGAAAKRLKILTREKSRQILVFFRSDPNDLAALQAVARLVPNYDDPLEAALNELLEGPTDEERATGLSSPFSSETTGYLNFASVENGVATVDFSDSLVIPGRSASFDAGGAISQLNATVFQFPEIDRVRYQINGSCLYFADLQGFCNVARPPLGDVMPSAVATTRDAVLEAAATSNYEALRRLITLDNFTFSYGGTKDDHPIAFWKALEKQGEDPLRTLHVLLTMPYVLDESGIYVWPSLYASDPTNLSEEEIRLARRFATQEEIDSWREFGLYFGYRVGIDSEGTWVFFVAGD